MENEYPTETVAGEPVADPTITVSHLHPIYHTIRDIDNLPIPHPAEQPRHVLDRAMRHSAGLTETHDRPVVTDWDLKDQPAVEEEPAPATL